MDWKHMVLGAIGVVIPPLVHYLGGVDWSALGPVWSTTVLGALQMINEVATNPTGSSTGGIGLKK
jgi:hypothetical protein